jgi:hypothetical protein
MTPLADEFDWSTDPTYSDYGGTPDTTSYNSDGTTNEGGTGYSVDLNSGSDSGIGGLFSGTDLAKLFAGSPLLKTLGAAGLGKLADKLFDVQKGAGGYKGGIPELVSSRQMLPIPRTMQDASGRTVARRPGSGGVSYFTPNQYVTPAQAAAAKAEQPLVQLPQQGPGQQVSRDDLFYQSPEFQAYQKSQDGMMGTMDMYNSPYFGQLGSGSSGRAMDEAYEKYKSQMGPGIGGYEQRPFTGTDKGSPQDLFRVIESARQKPAQTGNGIVPEGASAVGFPIDSDRQKGLQTKSEFNPREFSPREVTRLMGQINTPYMPTINPDPNAVAAYAHGGITTLGGYSDGGRLLKGPGDGVSDSIPAVIGKKQPARLADGEFVIPARIVSELGNGSTEAGARKLYAMMDRIKKARSKAKNIAADTKSDKHLPA